MQRFAYAMLVLSLRLCKLAGYGRMKGLCMDACGDARAEWSGTF